MESTSNAPHTDNTAEAHWLPTVVADTAVYKARFRQPLHPLVAHGRWNRRTYRMDLMHMNDHHGTVSTMAGCIMHMHLKKRDGPLPGANEDARMDFLKADAKGFYDVNKRLRQASCRGCCLGTSQSQTALLSCTGLWSRLPTRRVLYPTVLLLSLIHI